MTYEEAKTYLLKTIEFNPSDVEAYKLLTKICLKNDEAEEILQILNEKLQKDDNGDLYYCLARVYKFIGDLDAYYDNLELALKNPYTLTYPRKIVKEEFKCIQAKLDRHEKIEPEMKISEYQENNEEPEENSEDEPEDSFEDDDNSEDEEFDSDEEENTDDEFDDEDNDDEEEEDEFSDDEDSDDSDDEEFGGDDDESDEEESDEEDES